MEQLEIDLPASCIKDLRKQEGQEGRGGGTSPPSCRPIHVPDRKVQEGRRKQEGGGLRTWRDGDGRDFRQWWDYMRQVIKIASEMKDAREATP